MKYVTEGAGDSVDTGELLVAVLADPVHALLLVAPFLAVGAAVAGYLRYRPAATDIAVLRRTLSAYNDIVPWMLRLSVGLPLIGAGFAGYFFSPEVQASTRLFQVTVGSSSCSVSRRASSRLSPCSRT